MSEIKLTITTGGDVVLGEVIKAIEEYIKNFDKNQKVAILIEVDDDLLPKEIKITIDK